MCREMLDGWPGMWRKREDTGDEEGEGSGRGNGAAHS